MGRGVFADPRYAALASRAAAELGGGASLARAILAQWACEKADGWPPQDNNPGNVHVAALASVGITAPHGRGDGGAVALFATPEAAVDAYVLYIQRNRRYVRAVPAAQANDGLAFLKGLLVGTGYGTGYSCAAGYYGAGVAATATPSPSVGSSTTAPSSGPTPSSGPSVSSSSSDALNATQIMLASLGISILPSHLLTDAEIWKIAMRATGQDPNRPFDPANQIFQGYQANLAGKTVAQMAADAAAGTTYNQPDLFSGIAGAIAGLPAAIGAALGSLLVNGAVLVIVVLLAYKGLQGLVEA